MRIALIYNAEAGVGVYQESDLSQLFADRGYIVTHYGKGRVRRIEEAIRKGCDVVVAAGGDGTVARAAIELYENRAAVPLFILPLGTSNNIARSVGFDAPVPLLVDGLRSAREARFDIGRAMVNGTSEAFVESAGVGFIGTMLHRESSLFTKIEKLLRNLRRDASDFEMRARGVARLVQREPVSRLAIRADSEDLSGEYITAEALNIHTVGPRVLLAGHADPGDGFLDLLLVPPSGRQQLVDHVRSMSPRSELPSAWFRRVRRIEMSWVRGRGHLDDNPWPTPAEAERQAQARVALEVGGSIKVLLPPL